ncbi:MAG: RNA polymerase sigma factor [Ktedonobacteraceae bacterium]
MWPSSHSLDLAIPGTIATLLEQDDVKLVTASKDGDQDAFSQLVQRYQRRVFNLVLRMLQDYEEASETTQEAFLAAWQGMPSFRGEARFSTWLYRIAYNCALKQLELRKRERTLQQALQAEQMLESTDDDPKDAHLEVLESQELVQEHLSQLPAKYRIVLILRHLQDMTYEEMAEVLTMPIGTIKTHLFRARNLLKERLQTFGYGRRQSQTKTRG